MDKGTHHHGDEDCVKKQGVGSLAFEKSKSRKEGAAHPMRTMTDLFTAYQHILHATDILEDLAERDPQLDPLASQARGLLWKTGAALPLPKDT